SAAAAASSGNAELPGRLGDPGDGDVPGSATAATAAAAGAGTRLLDKSANARTVIGHSHVMAAATAAIGWAVQT
ncbi:MAG: hypothetical protein ABIS39_03965, partial [Sphingomicrobium sp.]